jgi:hypothetical protein
MANAGMNVFVGDDHAESTSANTTLTNGFACNVLCVDHTAALPLNSTNLMTTGSLTMTGTASFTINAQSAAPFYYYGMQFISQSSATFAFSFNQSSSMRGRLEQCLFSFGVSSTGIRVTVGGGFNTLTEFIGCTFNFQANTQFIIISSDTARFEGCSFTGTLGSPNNSLFTAVVNSTPVCFCEGCDFSAIASGGFIVGSMSSGGEAGYWSFKDCIVPSGVQFSRTNLNMYYATSIDAIRCDSGGTAYRNERWRLEATTLTSITVVRTGGAVDGATAISHQITTYSSVGSYMDPLKEPYASISVAIWNGVIGTNRQVTLYGIVNDTRVPYNDEFWFDVEYLGSASTPRGSYKRGNPAVLATHSALSADTSAWDTAATARANSHAYSVGDIIKLASNPGRIFFCTVAGTSAGSEPGGYAGAVDGGVVTDSGATFRAGCRFSYQLALSSPQPAQAGYLYAYPKFGRGGASPGPGSFTYFIDPMINLS